jgi:hypothetical protein
MATSIRTCFGVPIEVDDTRADSPKIGRVLKKLKAHSAAAIDEAHWKLLTDRGRRASYFSAGRTVQGVSILDDCALPFVRLSHRFLRRFKTNEVSSTTLPFVGFRKRSLTPLWSPPILPEVIGIKFGGLSDCYASVHYLARLNAGDPIWKGQKQKAWFEAFGAGLSGYMTELFSGRFVDRNGTGVGFDLKGALADLAKLDQKHVAPQLAGAIVTVLCEFLGDELFPVPFYSSDILKTYRDYRDKDASKTGTLASLKKLADAVTSGTISEADAYELLGIKGKGSQPVIFDKLLQQGKETPVIASTTARALLRRMDQLDSDYLAGLLEVARLGALLDSVEVAKKSDLQYKFTCFKCKVIQKHLVDNFIPDKRPGKQGEAGREKDSGRLTGDKADYSDLLGKLVAFGGTTAEKSVRSLVGGLIRGVAIASLQNEVVAEVVASFAGTLAKKLVEWISYESWYKLIHDDTADPDAKRWLLDEMARFHGLVPH